MRGEGAARESRHTFKHIDLSSALTIGLKTQPSDDKATHEQQVNQIKKLTASLKLANTRTVGSKTGRDTLETESDNVAPPASATISQKRRDPGHQSRHEGDQV